MSVFSPRRCIFWGSLQTAPHPVCSCFLGINMIIWQKSHSVTFTIHFRLLEMCLFRVTWSLLSPDTTWTPHWHWHGDLCWHQTGQCTLSWNIRDWCGIDNPNIPFPFGLISNSSLLTEFYYNTNILTRYKKHHGKNFPCVIVARVLAVRHTLGRAQCLSVTRTMCLVT